MEIKLKTKLLATRLCFILVMLQIRREPNIINQVDSCRENLIKTILLNKRVNNASNLTRIASPKCLTVNFCYPLEPLHYNMNFFHIDFIFLLFSLSIFFFFWIKPVVEPVWRKVQRTRWKGSQSPTRVPSQHDDKILGKSLEWHSL